MKSFIIDSSEKDENGQTIFKIVGEKEVPKSVIEREKKRIREVKEAIDEISRVNLNKLDKVFTF